MSEATGRGEFRAGWPVVLSSGLGIGLGLSPVPFYTIGVLAPALHKAFGWGLGQIMTGLPILTLGVLAMSPITGLLADRFGVRRVALSSVVLFSLTFMAFALSNDSLGLFYATWAALAVAGAGTLPITWTRAVNNRFEVRKGLALGLSLLGTGLFGALAKPLTTWLVHDHGWRAAYLVVGALPLALAFPVAWFGFHDAPPRAPLDEDDPPAAAPGMTFGQTLRDWRFWVLGLSFIPVSFAVGGPIPSMETILKLGGFTPAKIVALTSTIGLSVIAGRLIGGWLIDRIWAPAVAFVLFSLPALACWSLAGGHPSALGAQLSIIGIGFASGVEYDLMAFLVARYFGLRRYASIYGALYGFFALGAGIAPKVFGDAFDRTHSFAVPLKLSAVLLVLGGLLILTLGRYRRFDPPEEITAGPR